MIPLLPNLIWITFLFTVALTVFFFYLAAHKSKVVLRISVLWILIQSSAALSLYYIDTSGIPPRFAWLILPPLTVIAVLFLTAKGRKFIDKLDLPMLTALHMVRIPVEVVLYWLFLAGWIPELMTFAGRNFDIIAGVTAPIMFTLVFYRKKLNNKSLLVWNIICLCLVLFIVVNAVLSTDSIFQQFAFDQPNRAIAYFPFALLPAYVVPVVIFSHLASIRKLLKS